MRFRATLKLLGVLLMLFSISMLSPIVVAFIYHDGGEFAFFVAFLVTITTGFLLWVPQSRQEYELKTRDGFLVVTLFWFVLSLFGAIPLQLDHDSQLTFVNALFESVSGLTTTGATVMAHISELPKSILWYRQQLQFLGGMGVVVLAVAIMPMLGVGGMQLYKAETVGPFKTSKLRPRMAQTAKALWSIYVGLVVICAFFYWMAGMTLFDAIGESFSTISTGGFSTHDTSFHFYNSITINCIGVVFMLLGATNFALHYQFIALKRMSIYFHDIEFLSYLKLLALALVIILTALIFSKQFNMPMIVHVLFTVVSLATTTGLTTVNYNLWPVALPVLMMFIAMIGGCGGSTGGGFKVSRCLLMKAQGKRELFQLVHPRAIVPLQEGSQAFSEQVIQSIWSFASVYLMLFIVMFLLLIADGLDFKTAFGALSACISNTGASIGDVASSFFGIPVFSKWLMIFAMLIGRLEIFTLLVLLTPAYWRR